MDPLALLLHPVRLRLVHAMAGGRVRTTSDLCALLTDVPKTTVYRQVGLLVDGGVLQVVDERRVRGAVERHYRLSAERAVVDSAAAAGMSLQDHRQGFAAAMAVLLAEFDRYLDRDGADPVADEVGYRQGTIWLGQDDLTALLDGVGDLLRRHASPRPAEGRTPYLWSAILFPSTASDEPQRRPDGAQSGSVGAS